MGALFKFQLATACNDASMQLDARSAVKA